MGAAKHDARTFTSALDESERRIEAQATQIRTLREQLRQAGDGLVDRERALETLKYLLRQYVDGADGWQFKEVVRKALREIG